MIDVVSHKFMLVKHKFNMVSHKFNMVGHKFNLVGHDSMLYKQKWTQQLRTNAMSGECLSGWNISSKNNNKHGTCWMSWEAITWQLAGVEIYHSDRTLLCSRVGDLQSAFDFYWVWHSEDLINLCSFARQPPHLLTTMLEVSESLWNSHCLCKSIWHLKSVFNHKYFEWMFETLQIYNDKISE